jgi:catechol-2,3-dioxygenase
MVLSFMRDQYRPIKALGEIALRVADLNTMQRFYEEIVGLELMRRTANTAFFKIAEGFGGHAEVLAHFDRSSSPGYRGLNAATSTVDHIAFEISLADYESEKARLESLNLTVTTAEHAWVHWRSLYVFDPEGNEVERVWYDESVR